MLDESACLVSTSNMKYLHSRRASWIAGLPENPIENRNHLFLLCQIRLHQFQYRRATVRCEFTGSCEKSTLSDATRCVNSFICNDRFQFDRWHPYCGASSVQVVS